MPKDQEKNNQIIIYNTEDEELAENSVCRKFQHTAENKNYY